jgi:DNA repair protein RadC
MVKGTMIKELPIDERPREKLLCLGAGGLSNRELLAILIGSGTRRTSAAELADKLLALDSGGITYFSHCLPEDFCRIRGIGKAKSCQIAAAIELGKRIATAPVSKKVRTDMPAQVAELFMEEMRHLRKEVFSILMLTTKNQIICIEKIAVGSLNSAVVHPREVFANAIKRGAASVILVHNHPSGDPSPSREDLELTSRLVDAGAILGISVKDHLIIGDGVFISMKQQCII